MGTCWSMLVSRTHVLVWCQHTYLNVWELLRHRRRLLLRKLSRDVIAGERLCVRSAAPARGRPTCATQVSGDNRGLPGQRMQQETSNSTQDLATRVQITAPMRRLR